MADPSGLHLHEEYKRADVAEAFDEEYTQFGKWMSGVVPVGEQDIALFITLDKSNYSGDHRYEDAFESEDTLRWQSQTRASPDNAWGQKHIDAGPENIPHHLFVRTEKGEPFVYCGQICHKRHEGAKPMTVWWELETPLTEELYDRFEEATDHAGGRDPPDYVKSRKMDIDPAGEGLRAVPDTQSLTDEDIETQIASMDPTPWGWADDIATFMATDKDEIMDALIEHHERRFDNMPLGSKQKTAWRSTINRFKDWLEPLQDVDGGSETLIVFEYELPGEGGRRPDVVLVTPSQHIFVIECKDKVASGMADLDQALRYRQDLEEYHSESHGRHVTALIALLKENASEHQSARDHTVDVLTPAAEDVESFQTAVLNSLEGGSQTYNPKQWLLGDYEPLPHLMQAVINTFENEPLPRLKKVRSSNIPEAIELIQDEAKEAEENHEHTLVLLTGVPGSGKTLVGIESAIKSRKNGIDSLFLSGNGPLVAVLQDALDRAGADGAAKGLVRPMYKFKKGVTGNPQSTPAHVYVFDEGQRAWDANKNKDYDGSEIELLIEAASRTDWGLVVGLIGEGQQIYKGEKGSLATWIEDFKKADKGGTDWNIIVPERQNTLKEAETEKDPILHLDVDIRAKAAEHLHRWVEAVLSGDEETAVEVSVDLQSRANYPIHVTSSREAAEEYVQDLYADTPDPRYGWIISSAHNKGRDPEGMKAPFIETHKMKDVWGPWFNAPPEDPASCCQLERPCPEFACQGLELDFSLVFWGNDLQYRDGDWTIRDTARDWSDTPFEHTLNAYRVLLTRGREGMVIRCRDNETREYLQRCGATILDE